MNRSARRLMVLVGAFAMLSLAFAAAFPVLAQDGGGGQGGETVTLEPTDTLGTLVDRYSFADDNLRQFFTLNTDLVLEEGQTINFPEGVTVNMDVGAAAGMDETDDADAQVTGTPAADDAGAGGDGAQVGNTYTTEEGDILGEVLAMMGFQPDMNTQGAEGDAEAQTTVEEGQTIVDVVADDERFTTLVAAIDAANLTETLQGEGPFTVFAPTNEAFAKLPAGTVDNLLLPENRQQLTDLLTYHVVSGRVMAADVAGLSEADTVLGQPLQVTSEGGSVMINDAQVVNTDIEASNGVIHVIDTVLMPEDATVGDAGAQMTETPEAGGADGAGGTGDAGGQAGMGDQVLTNEQLQEFVDLNSDLQFVAGQMVALPQGIAVTGQTTTETPAAGDAGAGAQATETPAAGDAGGAGAQATETPAAGEGETEGQGQQAGQAQQYTVQAGEDLTDIADRFGVTVEQLLEANPDLVPAGTVLTIPAAEGNIPQTGAEEGQQAGQTDQQAGQTGQDTPQAGQTGTVQGQAQQAGTTGEGVQRNLPGAGLNVGLEHDEIGPGKGVYIVMPGESLSSIAQRLDVSIDDIRSLNPGLQGDTIYPLQRLIVPAGENPGVWMIDTPGLEPVDTTPAINEAE